MLASPIGSYQPGASVVHKLDARIKSVALVVVMVASCTVTTPTQLLLTLAALVALVAASRLPARTVGRSMMPIVPFALVVALFYLFAMQGGATLAALGPLVVTEVGAWSAALYGIRLVIMVGFGAMLLLTTTPTALTDAFESLLSPLGRLDVPTHEIAMVMSLALRFVPILSDEVQSVMDAQAARGGSFEEGGALSRLRALGAVLVPVFAGAMRHAQNLSRALDARCYEGGDARTRYHEQHVQTCDLAFCALCAAWLAGIVVLRVL